MSFTSLPMPKLVGQDWTHLFPKRTAASQQSGGLPHLFENKKPKVPKQSFKDFQDALYAFSQEVEAHNAAASSRPFPECFPLYVMNPKYMDTSISV